MENEKNETQDSLSIEKKYKECTFRASRHLFAAVKKVVLQDEELVIYNEKSLSNEIRIPLSNIEFVEKRDFYRSIFALIFLALAFVLCVFTPLQPIYTFPIYEIAFMWFIGFSFKSILPWGTPNFGGDLTKGYKLTLYLKDDSKPLNFYTTDYNHFELDLKNKTYENPSKFTYAVMNYNRSLILSKVIWGIVFFVVFDLSLGLSDLYYYL